MTFDLKDRYDEFIEEQSEQPVNSQGFNSKVLIIDGLNTFIRAFSVNPALNEDGVHVGGIVGFLKSIRYGIYKLKPTRVVIVFDGKNGSKSRRKIYPEYKSQRRVKTRLNRNVDWETGPINEEQAMAQQISRLVNYLENLPVKIISIDGIEADDTMAYIARTIFSDTNSVLMSTDKDFLHLVNDNIHVWSPTKQKLYTKEVVKAEFGIIPQNLLTWRAMDGDKSDNITGMRGAGLKSVKKYFPEIVEDKQFTIKDLIEKYKDKESKYKIHETLKNSIGILKRNYILMQLYNVNISNRNKLLIQNSFASSDEKLVKFKIQTMFIHDKLWGSIPNLEQWLVEFLRLERMRKKENDK